MHLCPVRRQYINIPIIEEDSYEKDVLFYVELGEPRFLSGECARRVRRAGGAFRRTSGAFRRASGGRDPLPVDRPPRSQAAMNKRRQTRQICVTSFRIGVWRGRLIVQLCGTVCAASCGRRSGAAGRVAARLARPTVGAACRAAVTDLAARVLSRRPVRLMSGAHRGRRALTGRLPSLRVSAGAGRACCSRSAPHAARARWRRRRRPRVGPVRSAPVNTEPFLSLRSLLVINRFQLTGPERPPPPSPLSRAPPSRAASVELEPAVGGPPAALCLSVSVSLVTATRSAQRTDG